METTVILGGGIAGLRLGWKLKQQGMDFQIIEGQPYPGGLSRSFVWHDFVCDFAAHRLFTTNEDVLQEILNLVPMGRHIRRSRIYLKRHWLRDPLDTIELLWHLSLSERLGILWSYLTRPRGLPEDCFRNYVERRYGKRLNAIFFQPYTEKLFGIPGEEISVLWARKKVRLANPFDVFHENTKTKFNYFYYPVHEGFGAIADRLYRDIRENVLLNTRVVGLEKENWRITAVTCEEKGKTRHLPAHLVISTLPLTETGRLLGHPVDLSYRPVDAVYLLINRPNVSDYHWIYFTDQNIAINRLVEFKNLSPLNGPADKTVLCAEVTQDHPDVIAKVMNDLVSVGLISESEVLDTMVKRERFAYPVYDRSYDRKLQETMDLMTRYQNLKLLGRAAEFEHHELDDNFVQADRLIKQLYPDNRKGIVLSTFKPSREKGKSMANVAVVILALNNLEDTLECLGSVSAADYPRLQVILVDNGSSDDTPREVRKRFPGVSVIENGSNLGVPAGYNVGFVHALRAGADYILMLNNDTVIAPDLITKLTYWAEQQPKAGILMPQIFYYGSTTEAWSTGGCYRAFPPAILMTDNTPGAKDKLRLIEYAPSCGILIKRQAFEGAGLFDPGYLFMFDDWDFSERVRACGFEIWYIPEAHMWHKVSRTTQGPRSPFFWKTFAASCVRFYRRHGRPVWISLPAHMGYIIFREMLWKRQWMYWPDFWQGIKEGFQKPLSAIPKSKPGPEGLEDSGN
jgi:GT2 family glycosyltransferase/protoporphyrinogen oxidase